MADLAGLYHTTISELERGVTIPSVQTLKVIATALGVELHELLQPDAPDSPPPTSSDS